MKDETKYNVYCAPCGKETMQDSFIDKNQDTITTCKSCGHRLKFPSKVEGEVKKMLTKHKTANLIQNVSLN